MTVKQIAKKLNIEPSVLKKESIKIYLEQKLKLAESKIFKITQKYGIKNVEEFDKKIKEGKIKEKDNWENFFELDNLESQREDLIKAIKELND